MTYSEKLRDPRWQSKRLRIMERDRFTCCECLDKTKPLNVHHCHYVKGAPWEAPDQLLLTLCDECHEVRQSLENEIRNHIGQLFARSQTYILEAWVDRLRRCSSSNGTILPKLTLIDEDGRSAD